MNIRSLLAKMRRVSPKHLLPDLVLLLCSAYLALYLRVPDENFWSFLSILNFYVPLIVAIRLLCLFAFGCYSVMWRYISTFDAVHIVQAISTSTAITILVAFFMPGHIGRLPRSLYIIDALLSAILIMGVRLLRRLHHEAGDSRQRANGTRTLVYGAGNNGRLLANRFRSDSGLYVDLVGFIDDDPRKQNLDISGTKVLGTHHDLEALIKKFQITQLIIAIPNISGDLLRKLVQITRPYNIRPRITTQLSQNAESRRSVDIYRNVELSDLLNRRPREIDISSIRQLLRGKRVMVTGAGGTIGSELARQILSHDPARLFLLDHSEYSLYEIDQELRVSPNDMQRVVPLLVDLKDESSLRLAMQEYRPEVVFHAAAYKHVHLVEANPYPALLNNVLGTWHLLEACKTTQVETFVLISSDKAVNPVGVMGASKRVCELLTTVAALQTKRRYCSVRFGNVLGSSGSFIPLLQKQIQEGGPVTITHPDITRYFMLIPEAVSLVLKGATIAKPGDINVLRMGEPIRIVDVAKSLIALMGRAQEEVPVVFTGLRPGEKMFEELYIRGDELQTEHPDILTLPNGDSRLHLAQEEIANVLKRTQKMLEGAQVGSKQALLELNELVQSTFFKPMRLEDDDGPSNNQKPTH